MPAPTSKSEHAQRRLTCRYHIGRHVVNLQVARTYEVTHVSDVCGRDGPPRADMQDIHSKEIVGLRPGPLCSRTALILGKAITGIQAFS